MGLFDLVFSRSKQSSPADPNVIFTNREQIRQALFQIHSLGQQQRAKVEDVIASELDEGKVTHDEAKYKLKPKFWQLYKEGHISSTDFENIKNLLDKKH
ncbi:MAG: hypothetical protein WC480_02700 [Patescibacteria group bacterium]